MTLAMTIFGLSLMLNVYLIAISGIIGQGGSRQTILIKGDLKEKVAVIPATGILMAEAAESFNRLLTQIEDDPHVKALVIEVDSPGGSVTASDQMYHRIMQFKSKKPGVPVVVSMGSLAASGGYYIACAADHIIAQPTTMTGNIGVILPRFNVSELFDKWGIQETTIHSTGADFKNAGSMFKPESPRDVAYIQDIADKAFAQFKDVVQKGRGKKLTKPLDEIANGKIYLADDAKALGLIDQVDYAEAAYIYAGLGLNNPTVVRYNDPPTLIDLLSAKSKLSGIESSGGTTINGIKIDFDSTALHQLMTPRLMYLWQGD